MLNSPDRGSVPASADASLAPLANPARHASHVRLVGAELAPLAAIQDDVAIADWDVLLNAVKARLGSTVADLSPTTAPQVRASVLECVTALDQLQTTLAHELGRRQRLELEVFDAQTALAQARAELAGTQAGERQARHLALHDSLTSLPNRGYFNQRLDEALAPGPQRQPFAVLYLDLDNFKPINDTHGHDVGDELLRIIAVRLARAVRAGDMVSRIGGDEFACLLLNVPGRQQLSHLACKFFDAVSAPVKVGKLTLTVRASIGIAMCPADGMTTDALLRSADAAMFSAKRQHSGYAFCERA